MEVARAEALTNGHIPSGGRGSLAAAAAIFLLTLACHLPLLGSAPLGGTEAHRALPARDMVRTGDWLLPRLYGQLYLIKPPLHDWLIAISQIVSRTGGNEFVWRLPSVLGAALLNVALYLFGARWFGRVGGLVSGLCGLGLFVLWGQSRVADIDETNTVAATLAALCLIELHFARPRHRWIWIVTAGAAIGVLLLTKGPGGLIIAGAVLIWAIVHPAIPDARRRAWPQVLYRIARTSVSPGIWAPLALGAMLFGVYALAAYLAIHRLHLSPDLRGINEGASKLYPKTILQFAEAMRVPILFFLFSLPVSMAIPLSMVRGYRVAIRASSRTTRIPRMAITDALAWSVLIGWLICLASGMRAERNGYVTIPIMAVLAGSLAASTPSMLPPFWRWFRGIACGSVILLAGACLVLTAMSWKGIDGRVVMLIACALSCVTAFVTFRRLASLPSWQPAWGLVALLVLLAVPWAYQFRLDRYTRSGFGVAAQLRDIVGPGGKVLSGGMLHSQPELFFYAGVNAETVAKFSLPNPDEFQGGYWVVLDREEYERWSRLAPKRLSHWTRLISHKDIGNVAWFSPKPPQLNPRILPLNPGPP